MEKHQTELTVKLMTTGYSAICDFLGYEPETDNQAEIFKMIQDTMVQMPEEEFHRFYAKYCSGGYVVVCRMEVGTDHHGETITSDTVIAIADSGENAEEVRRDAEKNAAPWDGDVPEWAEGEEYDPREWLVLEAPFYRDSIDTSGRFFPYDKSTKLEDLGLSVRAYHALKCSNHNKLGNVIKTAEAGRLPRLRYCGRKSTEEICKMLLERTGKDFYAVNEVEKPDAKKDVCKNCANVAADPTWDCSGCPKMPSLVPRNKFRGLLDESSESL